MLTCATVLLSSCGGSSSDTTVATPPVADLSPFAPLVLSIEPPTYAEGSQELLAFKELNEERHRCGFGLLSQNAHLDLAALAHHRYLALNSAVGHSEQPGRPGFTGADPYARAVASGYGQFSVSEGIAGASGGVNGIRGLLSAPYHAIDMLFGWKDFGVAFGGATLVTAYGVRTKTQWSDEIRTYPCAGTTGTHPTSTRETPAPFANFNAVWGQPILVLSPADFELRSAQVTGPQGAVPIKVIYGTGNSADPHGHCHAVWTCVIPEPLQPFTTYEVQLTWIHRGQPGGRTFTFATGGD
jgi:uncharacterized protein YkwD